MGFNFEKSPKVTIENTKVTISKEEYDDLCMMRDYIYDNNLTLNFEMYVDVRTQYETIQNQQLENE